MLVLNRRVNQSIAIGDDVRVIVVAVEGDRVKIGIQAPAGLPVHRAEVYDQILRSHTKRKR